MPSPDQPANEITPPGSGTRLRVDETGRILQIDVDFPTLRAGRLPASGLPHIDVVLHERLAQALYDFLAGSDAVGTAFLSDSPDNEGSIATGSRLYCMIRHGAGCDVLAISLAAVPGGFGPDPAALAEQAEQAQIMSEMLESAPEPFWCIEYLEPVDLSLSVDSVVEQIFRNPCRWRACNPAMSRLYRLPAGMDFHDQPVSRYFQDTLVNRAMVRDLVRAGYVLDNAMAIDRRHDGSEMLVLNSFRARVEDGMLLRLWGTVRDISADRAREDSLADQAGRMQEILSALPDPVVVLGPEGVVTAINPAAERGFGPALQLGLPLESAGFPPGTSARLRRLALSDDADEMDLGVTGADGRIRLWALRAALTSGAKEGVVVSARLARDVAAAPVAASGGAA